jgi:hypothetical protein
MTQILEIVSMASSQILEISHVSEEKIKDVLGISEMSRCYRMLQDVLGISEMSRCNIYIPFGLGASTEGMKISINPSQGHRPGGDLRFGTAKMRQKNIRIQDVTPEDST